MPYVYQRLQDTVEFASWFLVYRRALAQHTTQIIHVWMDFPFQAFISIIKPLSIHVWAHGNGNPHMYRKPQQVALKCHPSPYPCSRLDLTLPRHISTSLGSMIFIGSLALKHWLSRFFTDCIMQYFFLCFIFFVGAKITRSIHQEYYLCQAFSFAGCWACLSNLSLRDVYLQENHGDARQVVTIRGVQDGATPVPRWLSSTKLHGYESRP